MRSLSPAKLERTFAAILAACVPVAAVGGASCDGGNGTGVPSEGGAGSSSGATFSCEPFTVAIDGGLPDANAVDDARAALCCSNGPCCGGATGPSLPGEVCEQVCPFASGIQWCRVAGDGSPLVVDCQYECIAGRRPEGYATSGAGYLLGGYFASLATLEAASVPAFRRLARELAKHRAPRRLVKAAERAAREEVRHARGAAALAKRFGARPAGFAADVRGERSLEDVAIENAVEGCVRETYGALVATWQAREARDPQVRAHMARIAKEETSHAALAWKTDAWARGKLAKGARARVDAAKERAVRELVDEVARGQMPPDVARLAGTPDAAAARQLAIRLGAQLVAARS